MCRENIYTCVYICLFHGASLRLLPVLQGEGSEVLLEGTLDILHQASLSSVLPMLLGCYHLQSEAENNGTSHKGKSSSQKPVPCCVPDPTIVLSWAPQLLLTLFYRWRNWGSERLGNFSKAPQLICGGIGISQTRPHFPWLITWLTMFRLWAQVGFAVEKSPGSPLGPWQLLLWHLLSFVNFSKYVWL